MNFKLGDTVYCPIRKLLGQIIRIMNEEVTIIFITGDRVRKNINDIKNVNGQWRIDD